MIGNSPSCASSNGGLQKVVDVTSLFVGVESLFPEVIDSLYAGKLAYPANFNQTLKNVYDTLELKVLLVRLLCVPRLARLDIPCRGSCHLSSKLTHF